MTATRILRNSLACCSDAFALRSSSAGSGGACCIAFVITSSGICAMCAITKSNSTAPAFRTSAMRGRCSIQSRNIFASGFLSCSSVTCFPQSLMPIGPRLPMTALTPFSTLRGRSRTPTASATVFSSPFVSFVAARCCARRFSVPPSRTPVVKRSLVRPGNASCACFCVPPKT